MWIVTMTVAVLLVLAQKLDLMEDRPPAQDACLVAASQWCPVGAAVRTRPSRRARQTARSIVLSPDVRREGPSRHTPGQTQSPSRTTASCAQRRQQQTALGAVVGVIVVIVVVGCCNRRLLCLLFLAFRSFSSGLSLSVSTAVLFSPAFLLLPRISNATMRAVEYAISVLLALSLCLSPQTPGRLSQLSGSPLPVRRPCISYRGNNKYSIARRRTNQIASKAKRSDNRIKHSKKGR